MAPAAWARRSASSIVGENSRSLVAGTATRSAPSRASSPWGTLRDSPLRKSTGRSGCSAQTRKSNERHSLGGAVEPEDLVHHPELEGGGLVGEQDGDGLEGHTGDDRTIGRNLSIGVLSATYGGKSMSA